MSRHNSKHSIKKIIQNNIPNMQNVSVTVIGISSCMGYQIIQFIKYFQKKCYYLYFTFSSNHLKKLSLFKRSFFTNFMTYKLRAISRHSNLPAWPLNGIPNSSSEQVKFGKNYRYREEY